MLHFIKSGILTTIQDFGRIGYQNLGINPNGVMDESAARLLNILLGNDEHEAVLEMHFPAPEILFEQDCLIALGGADFLQHTNNQELTNWKPIFVQKGDVLQFPKKNFGARCYLAIKGGFEIEKWLESASTNLAANIGGMLVKKSDKIAFKQNSQILNFGKGFSISPSLLPQYSSNPTIRIIIGNEYQNLEKYSFQLVDNQWFTLKNESNRMGYRLSGKPLLLNKKNELISSAVSFGTVQLLPDGQLIILMADHQTTGGYPRIAHVISIDLPLLAQLNPNDLIKFQIISLETAETLVISRENDLKKLKSSIQLSTSHK